MSTDINTQTIEYNFLTCSLRYVTWKQKKVAERHLVYLVILFPLQVFHPSLSSRSTSCVGTWWFLDFLHGIHLWSWSWKHGNRWTSLWTFCTFQARSVGEGLNWLKSWLEMERWMVGLLLTRKSDTKKLQNVSWRTSGVFSIREKRIMTRYCINLCLDLPQWIFLKSPSIHRCQYHVLYIESIRRSMSTVLFRWLFPLHHFPINFMLSSEGHTCWARLKVLIWSKPKKWIFEGTRARKPKTDETGGENLGELGAGRWSQLQWFVLVCSWDHHKSMICSIVWWFFVPGDFVWKKFWVCGHRSHMFVCCMLPELTCLLRRFFLGCTKWCHPVTKGDARESEDESMNIFEYV